jgi:site-specific DNA recombinase
MLVSLVEKRVEEHYQEHQLDPELRDQIEAALIEEFWSLRKTVQAENRQMGTQKERLINERARLLQAHYAGAVPLDLLKAEQHRIARQLADIDARLSAADIEFDKLEVCIRKALDYATHSYKAYMHATPQERRLLNQAFFTRIEVSEDDIEFDLAEPFNALFSEEMATVAEHHASAKRHEQQGSQLSLTSIIRHESDAPAHGVFSVKGLKESTLVELRGLEPLRIPPEIPSELRRLFFR